MTVRPDELEPPSPEDDSNFRREVRLDMRRYVWDAVGNVSTEALPSVRRLGPYIAFRLRLLALAVFKRLNAPM